MPSDDTPADETPKSEAIGDDVMPDRPPSADGDTSGDDVVVADDAPASALLTRQRAVAAIGVAAVLALIGWLIFAPDEDEPAPEPATTTTTTAEPTSTTAPEMRPALISQVATAKADVAEVTVWSSPPPDWETAEPVITWDAPEVPASQALFTDRPDLPRPDYDIQGRYATATGWEFSNPSAFGDPFTMLVTEQRGTWAEVMVPVRPNGTLGYVDTSQVDLSEHDYRVELDISDRQLTVYQGTEVITDTSVVVGKDVTQTPTGRFYITDKTDKVPSSFYGPNILALNGYSEQLDIFDDGVPVIALHGTSRPDQVGQAVSNGCVRLPNEVVSLLNEQLPLGTQVEIYA